MYTKKKPRHYAHSQCVWQRREWNVKRKCYFIILPLSTHTKSFHVCLIPFIHTVQRKKGPSFHSHTLLIIYLLHAYICYMRRDSWSKRNLLYIGFIHIIITILYNNVKREHSIQHLSIKKVKFLIRKTEN